MTKKLRITVISCMMILFMAGFGFMVEGSGKAPKKRLLKPDLRIIGIDVDTQCHVTVKVKNVGRGMIPEEVYTRPHPKTASVLISVNGQQWGGKTLPIIDPAQNLRRPGGTAVYVSEYKVTSLVTIKAEVDKFNDVEESNEHNNIMVHKKLTCGGGIVPIKLPDLVVKDIRLIKGCKIEVTVANIGSGPIPEAKYNLPNAVGVQMYNGAKPWGGIILSGFDPERKLQNPGGTAKHIWFPNADNLNLGAGSHSIKVVVDNNNALAEKNETNNSLTRSLNCIGNLVVAGPITATLERHTIDNIVMSPPSPASLPYKTKVKVVFDYTTTQKDGIYIFFRPLTKGGLTPQYAAHGSQLYKKSKGKGDGYFMINNGPATVDKVRLQMTDKSKQKVLCEKIVNVNYTFPIGVDTPDPGDKAPDVFTVTFKGGYLHYTPTTQSIQIAAENSVLSYGDDWQKCQVTPYIYHIRQNFWQGFYWEVNTAKKVVYEVRGGNFCKDGANKTKLNFTVTVNGGGGIKQPNYFKVNFPNIKMVCKTSTLTLQISTDNKVLSYGNDWKKCKLKSYLYHFKQNVWQGFHWAVNTSRKEIYNVKGGTVCQLGGTQTKLPATVHVN